jgi:predicted RNase H-like HicB family nuclease
MLGKRRHSPYHKIMSQKVTVVIEKDGEGYYAYCPELAGCQSQGDTFKDALANIREAVELYLETLIPC